ncbi:PIG-L family deacetylase [Streptomyces albus]|uniref:PIG-L family deacetylase n=1 Tax=Streptomyces albus TaxID=1888 RepID=UPI000A73BE3D|nr:PIG-L family deacetylase [Streptomyces albus]
MPDPTTRPADDAREAAPRNRALPAEPVPARLPEPRPAPDDRGSPQGLYDNQHRAPGSDGRDGAHDPADAAHVSSAPDHSPPPDGRLPRWRSVLAVVAHPDDESFALGALLAAFAADGARVSVLCLTHGEASTLHGVAGDLERLRAGELAAAAAALGADDVRLLAYPDGRLAAADPAELAGRVEAVAQETGPDGLLVFDPTGVTGHPDHAAATAAALGAAEGLGLPVLGWTVPEAVADQLRREHGAAFDGHPPEAVDLTVTVDRARQFKAVACHRSQAVPGSVLWRRLELLGDREHLRLLRPGDD